MTTTMDNRTRMAPLAERVGGAHDSGSSILDLEKKESLDPRTQRTRSTTGTADPDDEDADELTDLSRATTRASTVKRPWLARLNPLRQGRKPSVPHQRIVCPEHRASFWSLLTFQWMAPLMRVGHGTPWYRLRQPPPLLKRGDM